MDSAQADDERHFPLENIVIGCHSHESFESFTKAISACVVSTPPVEQQIKEEKTNGVRSRRPRRRSAAVGGSDSADNRDSRMRLMFMMGTDCSVLSASFSSASDSDDDDVVCTIRSNVDSQGRYTAQTSSASDDDILSAVPTACGNRENVSKRRVRRNKTSREKHACLFELNKPVPSKFLRYIDLPIDVNSISSSKSRCSRNATEFTVLSMSPFAKGYINYKTELVAILSLASCPHPQSAHLSLPIISDFLAGYRSNGSPPDSTVLDGAILDIHEVVAVDYAIDTRDETLFVSSKFAHDFGVMNGGFVKVRMDERADQQRRYMRVSVVKEQGPCVLLSPISWFNLGGSTMAEQHLISIKKVLPSKVASDGHTPRSLSSASLSALADELSTAKQVTVGRVHLSSDSVYDLSVTEPLQQYMSIDRYMQVGDVFLLLVPRRGADDEKLLMKVLKVNNSNKTTSTYRVNTQTTLYEGMQVNSYIPPGVSSDTDVEIGLSFESTRNIVTNLLRPFVQHEWHANSLPFILLAGSEGSGRSLIIRQICQLLQCNYVEVNCVNLVADTVNSTETRIKEILSQAKLLCPAVLSLRNIDSLTKEEPLRVENPRVAQYFYTQLVETIESSQLPVIVFGTCNKLSSVSEGIREMALHEVTMQNADGQERLSMLEELTNNMHLHPDVCLQYFAEHTAGFLYGDLKALAAHAARNSLIRAYSLCEKHLGYVCEQSISSARILVTTEDFQKGLDSIQSVQSLDLGAPKIPNVKWADIGGLQKVKEDILDTIQLPLKHPHLFISAMRRSGVLLYGPPGTGKTLLAKAVATECALNFFSVKGPELINMYVGQSEENIRQVFHKARNASPCVIFFDELDSLAPNRGKSGDSGGVMDRVVSQLLAELDGLVKSCDVFVIGATNRPDLLDPALLRPGRFDKLVYVGISASSAEQLTILRAITRQFNFEEGCDLDLVSQRCPANMTGADLYAVCAEAVTNAIKRQIDLVQSGKPVDQCKLAVSLEDFLQAIEQTTPSLSTSELDRYEQVRRQFSKDPEEGGE